MEPIIQLMKVTEVKQVHFLPQCMIFYQSTSYHLGEPADNQLALNKVIFSKLVPLDWALTDSPSILFELCMLRGNLPFGLNQRKFLVHQRSVKGLRTSKSCKVSWTKPGYKPVAWRGIRTAQQKTTSLGHSDQGPKWTNHLGVRVAAQRAGGMQLGFFPCASSISSYCSTPMVQKDNPSLSPKSNHSIYPIQFFW